MRCNQNIMWLLLTSCKKTKETWNCMWKKRTELINGIKQVRECQNTCIIMLTRRPASADRTARRQFQATGQPASRTQASDTMTPPLPSWGKVCATHEGASNAGHCCHLFCFSVLFTCTKRWNKPKTNCFGFVLGLFWICFGIVLHCFVSVVRAALHCMYCIKWNSDKKWQNQQKKHCQCVTSISVCFSRDDHKCCLCRE